MRPRASRTKPLGNRFQPVSRLPRERALERSGSLGPGRPARASNRRCIRPKPPSRRRRFPKNRDGCNEAHGSACSRPSGIRTLPGTPRARQTAQVRTEILGIRR
jgi:hypothetical protein